MKVRLAKKLLHPRPRKEMCQPTVKILCGIQTPGDNFWPSTCLSLDPERSVARAGTTRLSSKANLGKVLEGICPVARWAADGSIDDWFDGELFHCSAYILRNFVHGVRRGYHSYQETKDLENTIACISAEPAYKMQPGYKCARQKNQATMGRYKS
jgi:hypothetical protein